MDDLAPNHHADYPQFGGLFGYLAGTTMLVGRKGDARLVCGLAGVDDASRVLDLGCGPGTAVREAAATGARVTGVDPASPMLQLARLVTRLRRPSGTIDWVEAGAEALPLPDASYDVSWSLASVHHWPDLDGGVAEVFRVLAPGGWFLALEKRTAAGATGNASHGWTAQQARSFAAVLEAHGFDETDATDHDLGRRQVVVVSGRKPA